MAARPTMANRCCVDRAYHIHLIRSNRLCYYRSSYAFLTTDMFDVYHTHLVILNRFCSLAITNSSSEWTVCCTSHTPLIWLTVSFVLPNHKQFIRVNRMLYIAHAFIRLPVSFVPPHHKQFIGLNRMPWIAHATKIWTVFDASVIANVLHLFSRVFYTAVCDYCITHSFVEGSLIVVSRQQHPAVVVFYKKCQFDYYMNCQ